jgi:Tfp pilus assembly protein PilO
MDETKLANQQQVQSQETAQKSDNTKDISVSELQRQESGKVKKDNTKPKDEKVKSKKKGKLLAGSGKKPKSPRTNMLIRAAILGVVIFILLIALMTILGRLPLLADEIRNLSTESVSVSDENLDELRQQLAVAQPRVEQLSEYFPDESGVVDFIGEIDKLKAQGTIDSFSFASSDAVTDKSKSLSLPVLIVVTGDADKISSALGQIQSLPYIIRAVSVDIDAEAGFTEVEGEDGEITQVPDTSGNTLKLKYGGLIYVDEDLGKN